jgi:hypothetical protein
VAVHVPGTLREPIRPYPQGSSIVHIKLVTQFLPVRNLKNIQKHTKDSLGFRMVRTKVVARKGVNHFILIIIDGQVVIPIVIKPVFLSVGSGRGHNLI